MESQYVLAREGWRCFDTLAVSGCFCAHTKPPQCFAATIIYVYKTSLGERQRGAI